MLTVTAGCVRLKTNNRRARVAGVYHRRGQLDWTRLNSPHCTVRRIAFSAPRVVRPAKANQSLASRDPRTRAHVSPRRGGSTVPPDHRPRPCGVDHGDQRRRRPRQPRVIRFRSVARSRAGELDSTRPLFRGAFSTSGTDGSCGFRRRPNFFCRDDLGPRVGWRRSSIVSYVPSWIPSCSESRQ